MGRAEKQKKRDEYFDALRRRAEQAISTTERIIKGMNPDIGHELLHELNVHQEELRLQNEELRESQVMLLESLEHYYGLFLSVPVSYFALDETGRIFDLNREAVLLLGFTRRLPVGIPLHRYVSPGDQDGFFRCMRKVVREGKQQAIELHMTTESGEQRFVKLMLSRMEKKTRDGKDAGERSTATLLPGFVRADNQVLREWLLDRKTHLLAAAVDNTERKKLEEELRQHTEHLEELVHGRTAQLQRSNAILMSEINERKAAKTALSESEQRYRSIVEILPNGVFITQEDAVVFANPAGVRLLGASSLEEVAGRSLSVYVRPGDRAKFLKAQRRHAGPGADTAPCTEITLLLPDGRELEVETEATPVVFRDGPALQHVFHDITEKKRAQEQILSYQKQLKKLASSISREAEKERHRIATTLHAGIGQLLAVSKLKLDLLEKEAGEDERIRGAVGNIRELLEQAIDESHRINFELFPPALHHLGLEPALKVLAENKSKQLGIPIRFSDDGNPKPIDEEVRDLLFQSVRELIQNAVKHADPSSMRLSVERRNESCVVRVEDDGAGFDPALLKDRRGKGFGLFSMELDVQHIGGSMKIESSPGKGTRTTLCMPLTRAAE